MIFYLMFVHYTFTSVLVAEWPPIGKELRTRLAICTIVFCLFVFYLFPILVLKASAITMPELVEINLVSDDENSLTDRKGKS